MLDKYKPVTVRLTYIIIVTLACLLISFPAYCSGGTTTSIIDTQRAEDMGKQLNKNEQTSGLQMKRETKQSSEKERGGAWSISLGISQILIALCAVFAIVMSIITLKMTASSVKEQTKSNELMNKTLGLKIAANKPLVKAIGVKFALFKNDREDFVNVDLGWENVGQRTALNLSNLNIVIYSDQNGEPHIVKDEVEYADGFAKNERRSSMFTIFTAKNVDITKIRYPICIMSFFKYLDSGTNEQLSNVSYLQISGVSVDLRTQEQKAMCTILKPNNKDAMINLIMKDEDIYKAVLKYRNNDPDWKR